MNDRALRLCLAVSAGLHLAVALAAAYFGRELPLVSPPDRKPVAVRLSGLQAERSTTRHAETPSRSKTASIPTPSRPNASETPRVRETPAPAAPPPAAQAVSRAPTSTPPIAPNAPRAESMQAEVDRDSSAKPTGGLPEGRDEATRGDEADREERLGRYVAAIRARVQDRKRYPPLARKRSVEGRVVARIAIAADGRIDAVDFDGGAPPLLRKATADAIRASAPYPAPPGGAVTIELPIDYALRDAT